MKRALVYIVAPVAACLVVVGMAYRVRGGDVWYDSAAWVVLPAVFAAAAYGVIRSVVAILRSRRRRVDVQGFPVLPKSTQGPARHRPDSG